jgi:poly-gamma-glutamate synthesis protein (capsule biosynthesis protein)
MVGIQAYPVEGLMPSTTVETYEAFVALLSETPGAVAVVPLDRVTIDVSVLAIDGDSPLVGVGTPEAPVVRIGFGGDILFGRTVGERNRRYDDYVFPLRQLKDLFASFDLAIANWECFISETIDIESLGRYDFVTLPVARESLLVAGIDAVSMANNHAFFSHANFGDGAYFETARYLDEIGMPHFGAGANLDEARAAFTTEVNGLRIAVFGIDGQTANVDHPGPWSAGPDAQTIATANKAGTNPLVMQNVIDDIERLKVEHDIVIPFFHMGDELVWNPRKFEVEVTRQCIDAGASAVITSHPHTIQGMQIYKGRPIFHGLGNLVYDQMFSVDTRTGYIVELTFRGSDVIGYRLHGFENFDFCQARLMSRGEQAALMNRFWRSTDITNREYPVG